MFVQGTGTVWGERLRPGKEFPALSPFWAARASLCVLEPLSWWEALPEFLGPAARSGK